MRLYSTWVLVLLRLLLNLVRLLFAPFWWVFRLLARPRGDWVLVRVSPKLTELATPTPWVRRIFRDGARKMPTQLERVRKVMRHVVTDPSIRGIVLEIPPLTTGWAACMGLRDALAFVRQHGKQVVVHLPRGGGNREMFVASVADRIYLAPQATLMPLGLSIEARYIKPLLERVGILVETYARGEYKTAVEPAVRASMSDAQHEQLEALLRSTHRALGAALSERPRLGEGGETRLFARGLLRGDEAVDIGFADGVSYEDQLVEQLAQGDTRARLVRAAPYLAHREARLFRRIIPAPYIAVVQVRGVIADQAPTFGRRGADLEHVVAVLRAVQKDRRALGVVLHVSSPGGSATASDLIHREVVRLRETKPVVAYFGEVAASGGYYIAAPAHSIVAQPLTVTGSIGVLSAKLVARDLLAGLGVHVQTLRSAPHADMFSVSRPLEENEREILRREIDGFYDAFVRIVADGRGKSIEEVDSLARGRVWSGIDAKERGLVDRLGGLDAALDEVRSRIDASAAVRRRLEPKIVTPRRLDLAPPAPSLPPTAAAFCELVAPEIPDLLRLALTGERAFYYMPMFPRVD